MPPDIRPPCFAYAAGPHEPGWCLMLPAQAVTVARCDLRRALDTNADLAVSDIRHRSDADGMFRVECTLRLNGGVWSIADTVRPAGRWLHVTREWLLEECRAPQEAFLTVAVEVLGTGTPRVLLPGINYDNNRSAAADRLVPRFPDSLPSRCLYEEHRYPVPAAHLEIGLSDTTVAGVSLQSAPSHVRDSGGNGGASDRWWSLGAELREDGGALLVHSSLCETNAEREAVYGSQNRLHPYPAEPVRFAPGERIRKELYLQAAASGEAGWTWRTPIAESRQRLFRVPVSRLTPEETIAAKLTAVRSRFHTAGDAAGFLCLSEPNRYDAPRYFLWGWTGQSARLAATLLEIAASDLDGIKRSHPDLAAMADASLRCFVSQPENAAGCPLPWLRYVIDECRWEASDAGGRYHSRQVGEALDNLARCIEARSPDADWRQPAVALIQRAAEFLAGNACLTGDLYPSHWQANGQPSAAVSASGAACISALVRAARLTGNKRWIDTARQRLAAYVERYLSGGPLWPCGATLDANCEDKEAGIALLRACLDLYDASGDAALLDWARRAADWTLTFMYTWNPGFRSGSFLAGRMDCTGWNSVSVQNQHLDVFTPVEELLRLSAAADAEEYARMAKLMVRAATQTIATARDLCGFDEPGRPAVAGEQAEQFFQTNYFQGPYSADDWRGGYNWWNPLWVLVHPLRDAFCLWRHECEHGVIRL